MFSKISRYYKLPDEVVVDVTGRSVQSKPIRLLPAITGTFRYTLVAGDRLDHLAFKYYKQPRKWWRICDANPEFMSPLALLGQEPIITMRFPLTLQDETNPPPWAALREAMMNIIGILDLQIIEDVNLNYTAENIADEIFQWAVLVTYNEMNVDIATLVEAMSTAGFEAGEPFRIDRIGKPIIVPPDSIR